MVLHCVAEIQQSQRLAKYLQQIDLCLAERHLTPSVDCLLYQEISSIVSVIDHWV